MKVRTSSDSDVGRSTESDAPGSVAPTVVAHAPAPVSDGSAAHPPHSPHPAHPPRAAAHPPHPPRAAARPQRAARLRSRRPKPGIREYTLGEEIVNSITHGLGIALGIVALVLLVVKAAASGDPLHLAGALVYAVTMIVEYTMSTLYHALAHEGAKRVFKVLDHSGIYLFIAGTYTPFCLVTLIDAGGIWLAVFVWAVALAGVAAEAFWVFRPRWVAAVLYLLLGWSCIAFLPQLFAALPLPGFVLLAAGGASYSIGCVFYVLKKIPYMHSVFHVWVLAASVLQFLAVYLYVV